MDLTDIKAKAEAYLDWPSAKRDLVTYTSAMLFAWQIKTDAVEALRNRLADRIWEERGKCASDAAARALAEIVRSAE
ncbi:hypothetical protein [uncultured Lamprocystis sp.]|jgi:hypothetical protein|uniref:hypothetical protein n=1 Tax=uncultured Lamprocystis sp. TaxID=543132 RepID=UPI0025D8E10C|nr:hypothetical protein [uncultured Lamprocystis sp.]